MKHEFTVLNPEENAELAQYRAMAGKERELARELKTPVGRLIGLAAAKLSEASLKE
jgi:nitrogen-specific signal transduction histidine kinase